MGSALVGSLFTSNLASQLTANLAQVGGVEALGVDANALTPQIVSTLDSTVQALVRVSYNDALTPVLLVLAPVLACGAVLVLFVKERRLRTTND